jgi:integrase
MTDPRRTPVKGHRSIYYRDTKTRGRRYEIAYYDSTGRLRWKTVDGGLREARAALEETRSRMRRGERVAPTNVTLAEFARSWLDSQANLRRSTVEKYEYGLTDHVLPHLGHLRLREITPDDVTNLVADMRRRGYAEWTIHGVLTPLSRILRHAARRGLIAENPVQKLEKGERPKQRARTKMHILDRQGIGDLLAATDGIYRALFATAIFSGLRQGELLALRWEDVNLTRAVLSVSRTIDARGRIGEPKTPHAMREVAIMDGVVDLLRQHRASSAWSADNDFVFATRTGRAIDASSTGRKLRALLARARLKHIRFHDLRHTYASLLIARGADIAYVSRQLGHASPKITLDVYTHLFDGARHTARVSGLLQDEFGNLLEGNAGERAQRLSDTGGQTAAESEGTATDGD